MARTASMAEDVEALPHKLVCGATDLTLLTHFASAALSAALFTPSRAMISGGSCPAGADGWALAKAGEPAGDTLALVP